MKKILLTVLILLVFIIAGVASYIKFGLPDVAPPTDLKIVATPERIAHGKYLANHVSVCLDCHSTRDWSIFSGPIKEGTLGKGGERFDEGQGFPGTFYSRNITPYNLKNWTDGEIFRAVTTGVDRNNQALFPVMPYPYVGKMDKEDVYDIIAYIRTLQPIESKNPPHSVDFPMNFILNTIPAEATFTKKPDKKDTVAYGGYLVNSAGCVECHTKAERGQIIPKLAFSGGREFIMPNGMVRSANITPDPSTGIGSWSATAFVARFKAYQDPASLQKLAEGDVNTIMPWSMYAGMDSTDLVAIYKYLRTVKPIKNMVAHFATNKELAVLKK